MSAHLTPKQKAAVERARRKFQSPGHYTAKDREKIPASDFGEPPDKFPIVTQQDVHDAARLIGKASNPDAVKARISQIAKRKGFSLPDAWQDESLSASEGERMPQPTTTRTEAAETQLVQMPLSLLRIDEANRLVTLRATSEDVDSFKTAFAYEASKDAFQRWERIGNIREMHAPKAVGAAVKVDYRDDERAIDVTLRVSKGAPDTWEKILDGTLKGGSIGASNVLWETNYQRASANGAEKVAKKYDLVELSLVDNPSNPTAVIKTIRAAQLDMSILDYQDATPDMPPAPPKGILAPTASPTVNPAIAAAMADAYGEMQPTETRTALPYQQPVTLGPQGVQLPPAAVSPVASNVPENGLPKLTLTEDITETNRVREADYQRRKQRNDYITAAGDRAVLAAQVAQQPNQRYESFVQRIAQIRGAAEIAAMREYDAAHANDAPAAIVTPAETRHVDETKAVEFHEAATPRDLPGANLEDAASDHGGHAQLEPEEQSVVTETHTHSDGTTHTHKVRRGKGATRADMAEHSHAFIGGEPLDASLLSAEFLRGTPWQIDAIHQQQMVNNAHPTTGEAESAISKVTPQILGHPVQYNTEDVNALGFAVPPAATGIPPTPMDRGDDITLDPAQFHPGGHRPGYDASAGPMDDDGDYDRNEDEREAASGPPNTSVPVPAFTDPKPVGMPTPMQRQQTADVTRAGARISADSMDAIHSARASQMDAIKGMCEHCGCPECKVILIALNHPDAYADMDEDDEADEGDMDDETDLRVQFATVLRQQQAQAESIDQTTQTIAAVLQELVTHLEASDPDELRTQLAEQRALLGDLLMTVADQQRGMAAQVTRAIHDHGQENNALLAQMAQRLEGVAPVVGELASLKATVDQIAATEARINQGPVTRAYAPLDPRFAPPQAYSPYGSVPENLLKDAIQAAASKLSPQEQAELAAKYIGR